MKKNFTLMLLAALLIPAVILAAADKPKKARPLRDGFGLTGLEGKLSGPDSNDTWFFTFDSDVADDKGVIKSGKRIELLKSAALERLIDNVKKNPHSAYRIWGKVTKYENRNFIFCLYFLPISAVEQKKPSQSQAQELKPALNEPNDEITVPDEIMRRLSTRKIIRTEQLKKPLELKQDSVLVDRTGFMEKDADGQLVFTLDALGRNVPTISIRLLGCQVLERAQYKQSEELEPLRFKAAGIVTKYRGRTYLLLQRARRSYSYGNFPG